ncbi:MAG: CoA transferase [Deltaproteobacteria bacterium]|nr:CoA transferase [Deltaproteobacteria bacterium]MBW2414304.1 CoA transferase [Deltaproteobacteria bacterium]
MPPAAPSGDFSSGPLRGVRLLDLSRVIAGPYIGRLFADLGAEVVKVEPPGGDDSRRIAPRHDQDMSALYTFANVGKRSIALDLSRPEAVATALDLVRASHAVVENFRPGVLDRLGLGWQAIQQVNPDACLLSISGFGSDSQWSDRRAYAPVVHAVAGVLDDQSRYAGQPVAQINDARADTTAALHGAVALLAALRVVEHGGAGQHVELPMFDALLTSYTEVGAALLDPPDNRVMNPIYDAGPHGAVALAGAAQYVWGTLAEWDAKLVDPTPPGADLPTKARLRHRAIEDWMAAHPSREAVLESLAEAGLAAAPVLPLPQVLRGEMARERDLLVTVDDRRGGTRRVVRPAARFSGSANQVRGPAPRLGEHADEVLRDVLGYDDARIASLRRSGALGPDTAPDD